MKSIIIFLIGVIFFHRAYAQQLPVEVLLSTNIIYNQFLVSRQLKGSNISFLSTNSLMLNLSNKRSSEVMNQNYFTYAFSKNISAGLGTFYSTVPGISPSVNLRYVGKIKHLVAVIVPRIDLAQNPTFDVMSMLEFEPPITKRTSIYLRLQTMMNYSTSQHNRSYQYLRIGWTNRIGQFGLAANFDAYGSKLTYRKNYGIFYRVKL